MSSRTLVLTDLIEDMAPQKLRLPARSLVRLAGATQAKPARHLHAVLKLGGEPAKVALQRMSALVPERVIFAHGRWFKQDGANRLAEAFGWLL